MARKKHRHSARERHVYDVLKRKSRGKSESHIWAMVMGMSPKTLHKSRFKTSPRTYSITHRRAAAARKRAGHRTGRRHFPR